MDLILEDGLDTPTGTYNLRLIHDMNVLSSPITTTASPLLPFGAVAGWVCGDRVFAWKVYTPQDGRQRRCYRKHSPNSGVNKEKKWINTISTPSKLAWPNWKTS